MLKSDFEKELKQKFFGTGENAKCFEESYFTTEQTMTTDEAERTLLDQCIEEIFIILRKDLKNVNTIRKQKVALELLRYNPIIFSDKMKLIERFFFDYHSDYVDFPELTGKIVGALVKCNKCDDAYDFLGMEHVENKMDWD